MRSRGWSESVIVRPRLRATVCSRNDKHSKQLIVLIGFFLFLVGVLSPESPLVHGSVSGSDLNRCGFSSVHDDSEHVAGITHRHARERPVSGAYVILQ